MAVNLSPVGGVAAQFFTNTGAVLTGGKIYTYAAGTTTPAVAYTSSVGNVAWANPIVLDAAGRVSGSGEIWITDGISYKFILRDSNDVLIATYDNITGINSNSVAFTNQQQIITATANQTVFNLSISYQVGTNSLSVFVDGVNQYGPGAQYAYTETDSDTVTFVSGLHVGAQVKFTTTQQQGAGAVNASQVSYTPAGTGAVVTNVQAKLRQSVSVQDFGAVGDGVADDTAAIQAAINAHDYVVFPEGNYKVTSTVTVNKAMTICVDGAIKTTGYLYQLNPTSIFYVTANSVIIEGSGTLEGPGLFSHDTVTNINYIPSLIKVENANNVTVQNLTFVNSPQAAVIYLNCDNIKIVNNNFIGGDTVASCVAGINYYAVYGYNSDFGLLFGNRITDNASGKTFAEGFFLYGINYTKVTDNYFKNVVDHDVYMYHSIGDLLGINNYNTISDNVSYTNLTTVTQKIGSSIKVHGIFNLINGNNIVNTFAGITLERGTYSIISNNTISGFSTIGIVVSDLVSTNSDGNNYVTISNNTLYGPAGGNVAGIYYRGDATFSTSNSVGGKIIGNTVIRCGNSSTPNAPIQVFHSNTSAFMDGFLVSDNIIIGQVGLLGMYFDQLRYTKITNNIVKDGAFTAWRGMQFGSRCTFNEITKNTVRDDQATPLGAIGCNFSDTTDTDNTVTGNIFHSAYASRDTNPWRIDPIYRIIGDKNVNEDTLGYPVGLVTAEAVASITASTSVAISLAIPSGVRLVGAQLRVDSALAAGDLWDAAYSGGSLTGITTGQAVAKNTKVNALYNTNLATDITVSTTNIAITKNGGGSFTAQGSIRALVYYEALTTLGNAA
jgi:hypothetical protein